MFRDSAITISLYLDKRKLLKSGKYPVKIQAASKRSGKWQQVFIPTGEQVTEHEWETIRNHGRMTDTLKDVRSSILTKQARALDIVKTSPFISMETFKTIYSGSGSTANLNLQNLYQQQIDKLVARGQFSNSSIYRSASNFFLNKYGASLTLNVIDKDFLENLEASITIAKATAGIYIRTLRTIFNIAIQRKILSRDSYPFGPREYSIPTGSSFKRALTESEKKKLLAYKPKSIEERKALAVWRVSYYCNGMNISDLALLDRESIKGDMLSYVRKKTARTERNTKPQVVVIRREIKDILKPGKGKVFDCLNGKETPEEERKKTTQWTKITNKYLKRIGKRLNLSVNLTTYVARHTAATQLLRSGADLIYIRDALGHSSVDTTEHYLQSLNLEERRKMTAKL